MNNCDHPHRHEQNPSGADNPAQPSAATSGATATKQSLPDTTGWSVLGTGGKASVYLFGSKLVGVPSTFSRPSTETERLAVWSSVANKEQHS